jgi:transcriptional regulator with XRE-family HTH domain
MKDILKVARENIKLKTRELAEITKIDQALISKFENGQRTPTEKQIYTLATALNIDTNTILIAWYKQRLLNRIDFNPQSIQAVTEILKEKGIELVNNKKELQIASILLELDDLKEKLSNL